MPSKQPQPTGYVTDIDGTRTGVILSIQDYKTLLENLYELAAVAAEGRGDPLIPHEEVTRILKRDGLL